MMMMKWRPWPPLVSKKFDVKLIVRRLEGCNPVQSDVEKAHDFSRMKVEVRWKGPKVALSSLRRTLKRNFTKEEDVRSNGVVEWDEEFNSLCSLSAYKDNAFHPWEIAFTVFNGLNQGGAKNKVPIVGTALLNLSQYASAAEQKEFEIKVPLTLPGGGPEPQPTLVVWLGLVELRIAQEPTESVQRSVVPIPLSPHSGESSSTEKEELSALKAGLKKVKILTEYVSTRRARKERREEEGSEERCSGRSEDGECNYSMDSDSLDDFEEGESDDVKDDSSTVRKSFSYGTLAYANCVGGSFYSSTRISGEDEDWIYYSNRKSDAGCSQVEDTTTSVPDSALLQSSKRSILPWRKRKLAFRSPKAKGEPLLKKAYAEEGGDDIDFDRRQLSSDESLSFGWHKTDEDTSANRSSVSEFGDDSFAIGRWDQKEVISRDGNLKLQTQVFFASIDQRSERAAGESACTALVAVIADWFQANRDEMPIKSQFDSLIREGSLEWRKLCENETYRTRFPDKHFDLETVLQAKIRPLVVTPEKSFIGFFHPVGVDEDRFDFLQGAMSFDSIWEEISHAGSECPIYIVSWNDHFFVLKVEPEAYYIIDTLGERFYEGCNQAYILKFDRNTTICKLPGGTESLDEKPASDQQQINSKEEISTANREESVKSINEEESEELLCRGKEACKEYIKSFLAAIPIRELLVDIKKGLMASTPLHHRLQIEFHYTKFLQTPVEADAVIEDVTERVS